MRFINGTNRHQVEIFTGCLNDTIEKDSKFRLIEIFVNSLHLKEYGFDMEFVENGHLVYHLADLLKLFTMNKIRSLQDLENDSKRNIEII